MIDTDKYEGHTPAPWLWYEEDEGLDLVVADDQCRTVIEEVKALNTKADEQLIADAPLLLAEVKRLRKALLLIAGTANGRPFVSGHIGLPFVHEVFKELIQ